MRDPIYTRRLNTNSHINSLTFPLKLKVYLNEKFCLITKREEGGYKGRKARISARLNFDTMWKYIEHIQI
jgi:hypothetical protein